MSSRSKFIVVSSLILAMDVMWGCVGLHEHRGEDSSSASIYDLVLRASDGSKVDFSRFRGKVLMVDLFATWSQPSMVAIAGYSGLYRKYKKDGLSVVGIALDELGDEVVVPFVEGMQIPYSVVLATKDILDGESVFGQIKAMPTLLIFDRSGHLTLVLLGLVKFEKLEKAIEDLL